MRLSTSYGSSPPQSLHKRWTPLHTHFAGRCIAEHEQLIISLQRALADAGPHARLSANAKLRGLLTAASERKVAIQEFVAQHRFLYGDVDRSIIDTFEDVRRHLELVERRVLEWDASQDGKATSSRKNITFSPSAVTPPRTAPTRVSSTRKTLASPRSQRQDATPPSLAELQNSLAELDKLHRSSSAQPSRSGSTAFTASNVFGKRNDTYFVPSVFNNASARPMDAPAIIPRPLGFLHNFSVESDEVKSRISVQHDEVLAREALRSRAFVATAALIDRESRPVKESGGYRAATLLLSDAFCEGVRDLGVRLASSRERQAALRDLARYVCILLLAAACSWTAVFFLVSLDDALDALRPYGSAGH